MNALVHRDYWLAGSTIISVLRRSLEISNPGGLPSKLKPSDLKKDHQSLPRNPDLAHVCFLQLGARNA
jgi:ATP-dependent DNA helicase RecG